MRIVIVIFLGITTNLKQALLIDLNGRQDELDCFSYDDMTELEQSCTLTWHNKFFVFGGYDNKRQISKVEDTKLTLIGSLDFDHNSLACDVMPRLGPDKIFLCFSSENDNRRCRVALDPLGPFSEIQSSTYEHTGVDVACSNCKLGLNCK